MPAPETPPLKGPLPDALQPGVEVEVTRSWRKAADRAIAATFLQYYSGNGTHYQVALTVAFYIGNDEWIGLGCPSFARMDNVYAIRQGGAFDTEGYIDIEEGLRPSPEIGCHPATGIALLRASGAGVPPLRIAEALPRQCTRLLLAGYWGGGSPFLSDDLGFPTRADCDLGLAPRLAWPPPPPDTLGEDDSFIWHVSLSAGTAGTAMATVFTDGRRQELPHLLLHRSDEMDSVAGGGGYFSGGSVITVAGEVVGIYQPFFGGYRALALPAIKEALAHIRAEAGGGGDN